MTQETTRTGETGSFYSNMINQWQKAIGSRARIYFPSPSQLSCAGSCGPGEPSSKGLQVPASEMHASMQKKGKQAKQKTGGWTREEEIWMQQHPCYFNFLAYSTDYSKGLNKKSSEINLLKARRFDGMRTLWAGSCLPTCRVLLHNAHHSTPPVSIPTAWRTEKRLIPGT